MFSIIEVGFKVRGTKAWVKSQTSSFWGLTQSHPSFLDVEITIHNEWCRVLKNGFLACPTRMDVPS